MNRKNISLSTLRRLPVYLHYLNSVRSQRKNISAAAIAAYFGLNAVQVRKDLGAVSGTGKPKTGYDIEELIGQIEDCLDCGTETKAVLVGAGNLGKALLAYGGFADYGLNIVAAFDSGVRSSGERINGKPVYPADQIEAVCAAQKITLGILAIPVESAQTVCDRLVACGIRAIWNFAPTILKTPPYVLTENENLASSLAILSKHLRERGPEAEG